MELFLQNDLLRGRQCHAYLHVSRRGVPPAGLHDGAIVQSHNSICTGEYRDEVAGFHPSIQVLSVGAGDSLVLAAQCISGARRIGQSWAAALSEKPNPHPHLQPLPCQEIYPSSAPASSPTSSINTNQPQRRVASPRHPSKRRRQRERSLHRP